MLRTMYNNVQVEWIPNDVELGKKVIKEVLNIDYNGKSIEVKHDDKLKVKKVYNKLLKDKYPEDNETLANQSNEDELKDMILDLNTKLYNDKLELEGAIIQLANLIGSEL